jgi:hypothetical protein
MKFHLLSKLLLILGTPPNAMDRISMLLSLWNEQGPGLL